MGSNSGVTREQLGISGSKITLIDQDWNRSQLNVITRGWEDRLAFLEQQEKKQLERKNEIDEMNELEQEIAILEVKLKEAKLEVQLNEAKLKHMRLLKKNQERVQEPKHPGDWPTPKD